MDQSSPEISTEKNEHIFENKNCHKSMCYSSEMAPNGCPYHLSCAKFPEMHSPEVRPSIPSYRGSRIAFQHKHKDTKAVVSRIPFHFCIHVQTTIIIQSLAAHR